MLRLALIQMETPPQQNHHEQSKIAITRSLLACRCKSEGFDRVPTQLLPKTHFEKEEMDRAKWWVRGTRHGYWSYPKTWRFALDVLGAELRHVRVKI